MKTYYIRVKNYSSAVKYQDGQLSIMPDFKGETLDLYDFIDECLLHYRMDYDKECLPLMNKIEKMTIDYHNQDDGREHSLYSSML